MALVFLVIAVTLHDSPWPSWGETPEMENEFSCPSKEGLNKLVGQAEMMSLWVYLVPSLECLLFVRFFSLLRWLFSLLVTNHHSLLLISSIKKPFTYFKTYRLSICSGTWIMLP